MHRKDFAYCRIIKCKRKSCRFHACHIPNPEEEVLFHAEQPPRCPKLMKDDTTYWCVCSTCEVVFTGTHKEIVNSNYRCPNCRVEMMEK